MADTPTLEAKLENGVMIITFKNGATFAGIKNGLNEVLNMIEEKNLKEVPCIAVLDNTNASNIKVNMVEMGKLFMHADTANKFSHLWIVGANKKTLKILEVLTKPFLGEKIHYAKNLKEAREKAKEFVI